MKRILIAVTALLALGASTALAGSASFNVSITIRQAISVTKLSDLDFGTVELPASSQLFTVTAAGGAQPGAGTGATAASFTISGEASQVADVSFASNPVTVTCSAGGCGAGTVSVTLVPEATTHTFSGGSETFYVGGNVTLTGAEAPGVYGNGPATLQLIYQ
jgi:Domain of unknown function (DUF4402)